MIQSAMLPSDLRTWSAACKKNYHRPRTEEELQLRREQERLKKQAYRARQKATRAAEEHISVTRPSKPKTRKAIKQQRAKWRTDQENARSNWTSQKWTWHKVKCSRDYYQRKEKTLKQKGPAVPSSKKPAASSGPAVQPPDQPAASSGLTVQPPDQPAASSGLTVQPPNQPAASSGATSNSAMSGGEAQGRATPKKPRSKNFASYQSPSPQTLKGLFKAKMKELKTKRSKKCLAARNLLLDLVSPGEKTQPEKQLYVREKQSSASEAAVNFLYDVSVDMPGKKSVSKKTLKQKKVLPTRMKRLHKEFVNKNSQHRISLTSFYRHRPDNVVTSRNRPYNMCLCEICTNLDLKLDVLNCHIDDEIDGRDQLSERSLCEDPSLACYNRQCPNCGPAKLKEVLQEAIAPVANTVVKWRSWDMMSTERGKRRMLVQEEGTLQTLLDVLIKDLHPFAKHLFTFRWQFQQFKTLQCTLPDGTVLAVLDFAENYVCKRQNEVQSAHWAQDQVTVHPTVLYYKCPRCPEMVTDYLVFLSDDLNHDANMVKTILDRTTEHLHAETEGQVKKMVCFSDGCASQYKSKLPFFHLANLNYNMACQMVV